MDNECHLSFGFLGALSLTLNFLIVLLSSHPAVAFHPYGPGLGNRILLDSHPMILERRKGVSFSVRLMRSKARAEQLMLTAPELQSRSMAPELESGQKDAGWRVEVRSAGVKGMGVFALECIESGSWVSQYIGVLSTTEDSHQRYLASGGKPLEYNFQLDAEQGLSIDGQNSTHYSRYINHAEDGNLESIADTERLRVDFFATRDIKVGDELTFDYGVRFWRYSRYEPTAESDSRNFSHPKYREPAPGMSLLYPPSVGTVIIPTPLSPTELLAAFALPEADSRVALMRCLEYFGSRRLDVYEWSQQKELQSEPQYPSDSEQCAEGDWLQIPHGVGVNTQRDIVCTTSVSYSFLQNAAIACIVQAILDPADPTGAESHAFKEYVESWSAELTLIRQWREHVQPFPSAVHEAIGLAAYLLWKKGDAHGVSSSLTREAYEYVRAWLVEHPSEDGASEALDMLTGECYEDAPIQPLESLVLTLKGWIVIGAGCKVVSNNPPQFSGYVPHDLWAVWRRVPQLVEYGLLTYNESGIGIYHPIC